MFKVDLESLKQAATSTRLMANPANPANWLTPEAESVSQLATLATLAVSHGSHSAANDAWAAVAVAELIEIDENLCRAELTASQRAQAIRRRKQIWEALHPQTVSAQLEPKPQGGRPTEFASETAKVSGEAKSSINRHLARADAIGDDLERVTGTSLDKGVELDALAKLPEPERKDLIARAEAGEEVSARKTPAVKRESLEDQLCSVINDAWAAVAVAELIEAAMRCCDRHGDGAEARAEMERQCLEIPPHLRGDLLDYFNSHYPE